VSAKSLPKIVLIDDDDDLRHALTQSLELEKYHVESYADASAGISGLSNVDFTIVVTDIRMPTMDGMECMNRVLEIDPAMPVVLITGHGNISSAVEAMQKGW